MLEEDIYKAKALLKPFISMLVEMMMLEDGYVIAILISDCVCRRPS